MLIKDLDIKKGLLGALAKLGYEETTPVQEKALPTLLAGKDAEVEAPTGTGKTLCYGIPLLNGLVPDDYSIQALVLCPTRELAIQVEKELNKFGAGLPYFKAVTVYGGQKEQHQLKELAKKPSVVVATPGRLLDFIKQKKVDISKVKCLILDECDEMLDMGFIRDINSIILNVKGEHQTSLYSATISDDIKKVSKKYLKPDFVSVKVVRDEAHLTQIEQRYVEVTEASKKETLVDLLNSVSFVRAFVFARTKHRVKNLEKLLSSSTAHSITSLQGNLSQNKRDKSMEAFRSYKADVMVATDIAARGIDISDVDLVINFDPPTQDEFYLHRIGRTGRVEAKGTSYTFLNRGERSLIKRYESLSKAPINKYEVTKGKGIIMNKYLLSIEKDLNQDIEAQTAEIKEACDHFTEVAGRTVLPIEIAAILLQKLESENTEELPSEKHFESIEKNKEKKASDPNKDRFFLNIGVRDGMDETALTKFLCDSVTGLAEADIGDIYMKEAFSFFSITKEKEDALIEAFKAKDLDGRELRLDKADERKPFKKSGSFGRDSYHSDRSSSYHGRGGSSNHYGNRGGYSHGGSSRGGYESHDRGGENSGYENSYNGFSHSSDSRGSYGGSRGGSSYGGSRGGSSYGGSRGGSSYGRGGSRGGSSYGKGSRGGSYSKGPRSSSFKKKHD